MEQLLKIIIDLCKGNQLSTEQLKTIKLITALYDDKILHKVHHQDETCTEFLFMSEIPTYSTKRTVEMRGWGTAFGSPADRINNIVENPTAWEIYAGHDMSAGYPYPWSAGYNKITTQI